VLALLPLDAEKLRSMVLHPPLSDAEFEALCQANESVQFERTLEGEIVMQAPAGGFSSRGNAAIVAQLYSWWKLHRRGWVYDSSGGFFLSDGSMLSPDAAYALPKTLSGFTREELTGFPRLCPDFVVELLSSSDSLPKAQEKMRLWIANGAAVGWLIDPYQKTVYVYESAQPLVVASGTTLRGTGPVEGFTFDLDELWHCYEL
jgi:Uma2 family endonuclease